MMNAAQGEFIHTVKTDESTVRVRLTVKMLFDLLLGYTLRFKTAKMYVVLTRKP